MNIGDVLIIPFAIAMTEGIKSIFGTEGRINQIIPFVITTLLSVMAMVVANDLVSPQVEMWLKIVVQSLSYGLSAIGVFDYAKKRYTATQ